MSLASILVLRLVHTAQTTQGSDPYQPFDRIGAREQRQLRDVRCNLAYESPCLVANTLLLQVPLQHHHRHVVSLLINIHKLWNGARLGNCFGRCNKSIGYSQHNVARLNTGRHNREAKRICSTTDRNRVSGIAEPANADSKLSTIGPPMKLALRSA